MKKYLIYYIGDVEDGISPLYVCETEKRAEEVVQEIITFGNELCLKFANPKYKENYSYEEWEKYCQDCEHDEQILAGAKFPYDYQLNSFDDLKWTQNETSLFVNNLRIKELPVV